jgi:RNA polymerase sigma factor (sigma-70 family)
MKKSRTFDEILRLNEDSDPAAPALVRPADEQILLWYGLYADKLRGRLLVCFDGAVSQHADDAVSETFLRLHIALLAGESIDRPYAWVCRVAGNLMLDEIKRGKRTQPICPDTVEGVRDPLASQHDVVWKKHRGQALQGAMSRLQGIERRCLILRAEGRTLAQVGEVVSLRHQRVREIIARAIERLAEAVRD